MPPIRVFALALLGALLAFGLPARAAAQVLYGSLVVEVRDQSGSAVPGAEVMITQTETSWTRSGTSNELGTVSFSNVPLGTFSVRTPLAGFKESVTTGVRVTQDDITRVRTALTIGELAETLTVVASSTVLQTERADVRTEISSVQLQNLPVPAGRNYQNMFVMVPGISPPENMHSVAVNPARGLGFNSNGTTRNANAIRIEGAISNNLWLPHVAAYVPALEAIETVSVVTSSFDADIGLSGGMSANVVIKSGTNQFRGSGFDYFYNEHMKSRPYFLPADQSKPQARQNQFGGTLGGPIVRNRMFFFGSYEGHQRSSARAAIRHGADRGDAARRFLGVADADLRSAHRRGQRHRPNRVPGNIIPQNRLDPIVQKLIATLPLPTFPDLLADNYFATGQFEFARRKTDAKVTVNATPKLILSGRLGWLNYDFTSPPMFGDLGGSPVFTTAAKAGHGLGDTYTITGSANYTLKSNLLIEAYTGITKIKVTLGTVPDGREPGPRFPRHSRDERAQPPVRRLAAVQRHESVDDRLCGKRELAVPRRQLAVPVHGECHVDRTATTRSASAATSSVRR